MTNVEKLRKAARVLWRVGIAQGVIAVLLLFGNSFNSHTSSSGVGLFCIMLLLNVAWFYAAKCVCNVLADIADKGNESEQER